MKFNYLNILKVTAIELIFGIGILIVQNLTSMPLPLFVGALLIGQWVLMNHLPERFPMFKDEE